MYFIVFIYFILWIALAILQMMFEFDGWLTLARGNTAYE